MRCMRGVNLQLLRNWFQNFGDAICQRLTKRVRINRPVEFMLTHPVCKTLCRSGAKISADQRIFNLFERAGINACPAKQIAQR